MISRTPSFSSVMWLVAFCFLATHPVQHSNNIARHRPLATGRGLAAGRRDLCVYPGHSNVSDEHLFPTSPDPGD